MKHSRPFAGLGLLLMGLAGCTAVQVQDTTAEIAGACQIAKPLALQAIALPTAGPFIAAGVLGVCVSDEAMARAAQDPSTAQWLDQQAAHLRKVLDKVRGRADAA